MSFCKSPVTSDKSVHGEASIVLLPATGPTLVADGGEDVLHFGQEALVERFVDRFDALLELLRARGADQGGGDVPVRRGELQRQARKAGLALLAIVHSFETDVAQPGWRRMPLRWTFLGEQSHPQGRG